MVYIVMNFFYPYQTDMENSFTTGLTLSSFHNAVFYLQMRPAKSSITLSKCDKSRIFELLLSFGSRHDKTNKVTVRRAKTQISLGIRPV